MPSTLAPWPGTISIAANGTAIVGTGAALSTANSGAILIVKGLSGQLAADPDDDNTATLLEPISDADITDAAYILVPISGAVVQAQRVRTFMEQLGAIGATGIQPNAYGYYADRSDFDAQGKGYVYLSLDGDGTDGSPPILYVKNSVVADDWKVFGGVTESLGPDSAADGSFVAFDGTTGRAVKDSGKSASSFATAAQGEKADSAVQPSDLDSLQNLTELGIGTTADSDNPFSAKLNSALWTAKYSADGGSGDLRYLLNKEASAKSATTLYQANFVGHAEVGLAGDDNFHFKVSPDGSAWTDAIVVDKTSGRSTVVGLNHAATAKPLSGFISTPGGDGQVSIWRIDIARPQTPRTATLSSVSGDVLTLTTAISGQFFAALMAGVSWLRIWNITKSPVQSAWIKAAPTTSQLQVIDATAIASWTAGDTIRLGEGAANGNGVAIDISPMLLAITGAVFQQQALLLRVLVEATGGVDQAQIGCSPTGASGSYFAAESSPNGQLHNGTMICPTSVLSPVSNSNLLFFRETILVNPTDVTLGRLGASVLGVFA